MIQLPAETFLESFPGGAALIGSDRRVIQINARLEGSVGLAAGRLCHEVLAGRDALCPFCPLDDLIAGVAEPVLGATDVRHGRTLSVDVRFLGDQPETGTILETVRDLSEEERSRGAEGGSGEGLSNSLRKCTGLLRISRRLWDTAPFEETIPEVLSQLKSSLNRHCDVAVWAEVDQHMYGDLPPDDGPDPLAEDIQVQGRFRGRLFATCLREERLPVEDEAFIRDVADLIGRKLERLDYEESLQKAEEQYKQLAGNLAKEMWSRTEALAKETGYLEGILRSSDDIIITTDLDARIVEFNPGAQKILGYTVEEVQGKEISDLWEDAEERTKILEKVRGTGGVRNYETRLKTKSGETREISLTLSLLKNAEGRILGTVGISKDITKEKEIVRELERLNQNYRETIHFISHESKNSLIVIAGFVRRLLEAETDPARKEQLDIIYHHAKFLEAMSKDFLVLAELEHGEFRVRKELIKDLYIEVILPAMVGLKERYPDSFESYDVSMGGVGAIEVMGDRGLLEIVYRNLFGNALKYRYPHGKVSYGVVVQPHQYIFNVWNEGPGVAPDQRERIFDKFYRVDEENVRQKRGTGLGLYNIRRIIEAHGGRIWCESGHGSWVNFLFALPRE